MVGPSSPLFFTGFLQAKVIKRVIRMLKTDVNNRNETAVTDERLGQERAQLVEMTPLPRSGSPPPRHSLFLFRPLLPPSCGLRRPTGDTPVKIAFGTRRVAVVPGSRAGGRPEPGKLQARALIGREVGAAPAPQPSPGPLPGRRDLRVASVAGLAARAPSPAAAPAPPACAPAAANWASRARWPSAARFVLASAPMPLGLCRLFSQTKRKRPRRCLHRPLGPRKPSRPVFGALARGAAVAQNLESGPSLSGLRWGLESHAESASQAFI